MIVIVTPVYPYICILIQHFLCVFHQIKYAGSDTDFSASPAFCKQISRVESEEQKVIGTQTPLQELLEGLIADKELPAKDKRKRLKQVLLNYLKRIRVEREMSLHVAFVGVSLEVLMGKYNKIP